MLVMLILFSWKANEETNCCHLWSTPVVLVCSGRGYSSKGLMFTSGQKSEVKCFMMFRISLVANVPTLAQGPSLLPLLEH